MAWDVLQACRQCVFWPDPYSQDRLQGNIQLQDANLDNTPEELNPLKEALERALLHKDEAAGIREALEAEVQWDSIQCMHNVRKISVPDAQCSFMLKTIHGHAGMSHMLNYRLHTLARSPERCIMSLSNAMGPIRQAHVTAIRAMKRQQHLAICQRHVVWRILRGWGFATVWNGSIALERPDSCCSFSFLIWNKECPHCSSRPCRKTLFGPVSMWK